MSLYERSAYIFRVDCFLRLFFLKDSFIALGCLLLHDSLMAFGFLSSDGPLLQSGCLLLKGHLRERGALEVLVRLPCKRVFDDLAHFGYMGVFLGKVRFVNMVFFPCLVRFN